jgi:hypothetical protein
MWSFAVFCGCIDEKITPEHAESEAEKTLHTTGNKEITEESTNLGSRAYAPTVSRKVARRRSTSSAVL